MPVLAGDIGGMTTRLAYFETHGDKIEVLAEGHDKLKGPAFMMAFSTKGSLTPLLESIPVQVIEPLCLVR